MHLVTCGSAKNSDAWVRACKVTCAQSGCNHEEFLKVVCVQVCKSHDVLNKSNVVFYDL